MAWRAYAIATDLMLLIECFLMNNKRCIALVGLSTIESLGVKWILQNNWNCQLENFSSFSEFMPLSESSDAFIVTPEIFVSNLDFFLPRKQKTVLVMNGRNEKFTQAGGGMIFPDSDETEMRALFESLIKSLHDVDSQAGELSGREIEVLRLISAGKINKEIADELCISVNTVITHRKNISSKLGIKSASGLSLYALMNGLI